MNRKLYFLLLSISCILVSTYSIRVGAEDIKDNSLVFRADRIEGDNSDQASDVSELAQSLFQAEDSKKLEEAKKATQEALDTASDQLFTEAIQTKSQQQAGELFLEETTQAHENTSTTSVETEIKGSTSYQLFYGFLLLVLIVGAVWASYRINGENEYAESH